MSDRSVVYITLDEWVDLAAEVLDSEPEVIRKVAKLHLADSALHAPAAGFGDVDTYPDLVDKAAVLGWHLAKNHAAYPQPHRSRRGRDRVADARQPWR